MRNINIKTIFVLTVIFGVISTSCFFVVFAKEEETIGTNIIGISFEKLYSIFRFPTHILFEPLIIKSGKSIFFVGIIINCLFYGIVTERIIYYVKGLRKQYIEKKAVHNSGLTQ